MSVLSLSLSEALVAQFLGMGNKVCGASTSDTIHLSSEAGGKCSSFIFAFRSKFKATFSAENEEEAMSSYDSDAVSDEELEISEKKIKSLRRVR
jgi:hypothetical protein